jgi:hypothetical protein
LGIFGQEFCDVLAPRQIPEQEIHVNLRALEQAAKMADFNLRTPSPLGRRPEMVSAMLPPFPDCSTRTTRSTAR